MSELITGAPSNKFVISEWYGITPDINLINESIQNNQPVILTGILQKANTLNRNGRVYPDQILRREVEKYMQLVAEGSAGGELDHPSTAVVSLANVSHLVTEMWWEGDTLYGKVRICDTPSGDILKGLLKSGMKLGISSRGIGSVKRQNNQDIVQSDFDLIAFDFVSSPSTPGAYMFKEGREWGLVPLTDESSKILKTDDVIVKNENTIKNNDLLKELLNNNFWK